MGKQIDTALFPHEQNRRFHPPPTAESSMGDTSSDPLRRRNNFFPKSTATLQTPEPFPEGAGDEIDGEPNIPDGGDPSIWAAFNDNFRRVQSVLDRNRVLIQQVNENHQSKIHENMVKNVSLIQEINGNITKVVSLYSDLSASFSGAVHRQSADGEARSNSSEEQEK